MEDCTDGLDNDGDSYVDCQDDDCWSLACSASIEVRINGGTADLDIEHSTQTYNVLASSYITSTSTGSGGTTSTIANCPSPSASSYSSHNGVLNVADVSGSIITRNTAGDETGRCLFTVADASFSTDGEESSSVFQFNLISRAGLTITNPANCRINSSAFLPNRLRFNHQAGMLTADGPALFYRFSDSTYGTSSFRNGTGTAGHSSCSYSTHFTSSSTTFAGDLIQGDVLTIAAP